MGSVRFLHIVKDDKFVDLVMAGFAEIKQVSSEYVHYHPKGKPLKYIDKNSGVQVFTSRREFSRRIGSPDYDVLYIHSLHPDFYPFIKSIPQDKIVIWWEFGFDIYGQRALNLDSFISLPFLKEETLGTLAEVPLKTKGKRLFFKFFLNPLWSSYRKRFLPRVDYFQPVCSIDYDLMKEQTGFAAKDFYLPTWSNFSTGEEKPRELDSRGRVLIANSAVYEENHLDVWRAIKPFIPKEQELLVPLNYGDSFYARQVRQGMQDGFHGFRFLDTFLPREEYFALFDSCSYAAFGTIRQHAMGNIYNALLRGLKVFLFPDSVVYRYLKGLGCVVFSLDDIGEDSFRTPLSAKEQEQNFRALQEEQSAYRRKGQDDIEEIMAKFDGAGGHKEGTRISKATE